MEETLPKVTNVHLVGIGGIGMSALAFLLREKGIGVSGSDLRDNPTVNELRKSGIKVYIGHRPEHITHADLVCISSAVGVSNPEVRAARSRGVPVWPRARMLAALAAGCKSICVSGAHGKTTTTSLLGFVLSQLGFAPTVCIGGVPLNFSRHAWWGKDYFVIEADESDGSFLYYTPEFSVLTNIDTEHLEYYGTPARLREAFKKFAANTKHTVVACAEDPQVRAVTESVTHCWYGFDSSLPVHARDVRCEERGMRFTASVHSQEFDVFLPLVGAHNVLNALAVFSVCSLLCAAPRKVTHAVREFKGTHRRFQFKAQVGGVTFIDDYAHHPTEIRAVLQALKYLPAKRRWVIFEPHRFTRVKRLADEFAECFAGADTLILTDIYSAAEAPLPGATVEDLFRRIRRGYDGQLYYVPKHELAGMLGGRVRSGDVILGLGAGEISELMEKIIDEFRLRHDTAG
ncbi:MAG: UDP-N-acetylmuramate--L-alanine ligase [Candidatus Omnitrophica bacterium]|nr:UDP-N-acetylmuramate--L-alanine ligase [Candidatus Omnitrophota bacterium]